MSTAPRTDQKTAAGGVEVRPVETARDIDGFWKAELAAQGSDPAFTPRLHKELKDVLTPKATPFAKSNDGMAWTAFRDGRPVGRIYAVQHHAHLERHRDGAGHFGFLEAIDDDAVWDALFATASDFLRARGLTKIAGPFSASVNHECGLQVVGHGVRASTHTNYAPPYYAAQLERLGFRGVKDIVGYEGDVTNSRLPQRVASARAKWADGRNLELRPAIGPEALGQIVSVYNDAWADNWGSVPVTMEESKFLAELAADVLPRDWTTLAFWLGEPIGVIVMTPDVNEAARDLGGRLAPFGWAKLIWRLKVSGVKRARVPVIGVRRAFRGTRVGAMTAAMLLAESVTKAKGAGVKRVEVSWMLEENRPIINLVRGMPAEHTKTWRIYSKPL